MPDELMSVRALQVKQDSKTPLYSFFVKAKHVLKIAGYVNERRKSLIVVFNKWDLAKREGKNRKEFAIRDHLKHYNRVIGRESGMIAYRVK